ncbi:MAG TPA: dihydroorotase [Alphaproteobacteria bacterium]|nr:dihydroorotase [Alphaproteobacteria bacterium]
MSVITGGPAGRTAYLNARLLDPASGLDTVGDLLTVGGEIADLGPGLFKDGAPPDAAVVDCAGGCLAPGLVDMRVQLREPGDEHKETIKTASAAASAGGVTAMVCLPDTNPPIDDVAVLEFIARRAREVRGTKVFCYGAATRGLQGTQLTEMGLLSETGAVAFTDGGRAIANAQVMRRALLYAGTFDALLVQHPQEPTLAKDGDMNAGEVALRLGLSGIPAVGEVMMIERDLRLAESTGGRYHAAHISTAAAVEAIRAAKARGLRVTCDTAPPYFTLNETAVGDYRTFAKLDPPLRAEADREAIVEGLADGTIDVIASDHSPHDQDSKRLPFAQAEFGIVGLETLLPLSLALVHKGRMGLNALLACLTVKPAELLGLPLGRLAKGAPADLVLFDLDRPWRIDPDQFRSKSKNSPFGDAPVQGHALRTVVAGRPLFTFDNITAAVA